MQKNGSWGKGELIQDPLLGVHVASSALNYGQSVRPAIALTRLNEKLTIEYRSSRVYVYSLNRYRILLNVVAILAQGI